MANDLSAYAGAKGAREYDGPNGEHFVLVYNSLTTTLPLGGCYVVLKSDDSVGTSGFFPTPLLPVTNSAVLQEIGVVNNSLMNDGTILPSMWGYVQTKGYCENVLSTTTITNERVQTTTNGTNATSEVAGTTIATNTFAIAKAVRTGAGLYPAYLLGMRVACP